MKHDGSSPEEMTFEQAFTKLEEIVRRLESEEVSLDDSLKLFEQGVALSRLCAAQLDRAEGKMQLLLEDGDTEHIRFDAETGGVHIVEG